MRVLAVSVLVMVLAACSSSGGAERTPVPEPRFEPDAVYDILRDEWLTAMRSGEPASRCVRANVSYEGSGLWECGRWSFDEVTGKVWRK